MLLDQTGRQLAQSGLPTDVSDTVQRAHVELTTLSEPYASSPRASTRQC